MAEESLVKVEPQFENLSDYQNLYNKFLRLDEYIFEVECQDYFDFLSEWNKRFEEAEACLKLPGLFPSFKLIKSSLLSEHQIKAVLSALDSAHASLMDFTDFVPVTLAYLSKFDRNNIIEFDDSQQWDRFEDLDDLAAEDQLMEDNGPSSLDEDGLLQAKITITEDVGELEEEEENNYHKGGNADSIKIKPLDNWECKYCHESYVKDEDRVKHLETVHSEYFIQETLPCDQCEKRFSTKTRRKDHQKQVHRKNFKCDKCDYATKTQKSLDYHTKIRHSDKSKTSKCDDCGQEVLVNRMGKHKRAHKNLDDLAADDRRLENNRLSSPPDEDKELLQAKITLKDDVGKLEEEKEEKNDNYKGGHVDGIRQKPLDKWQCKYCQESYVKDEDRVTHLEIAHPAFFLQETFPCEQCEKRFSTKTRRRDHQKVHTKNFKCEQCNYATKTQKSLDYHVKIKHPDDSKTSICDDCGQEVLVKLMGKHKRTHFNFKCTPCNRHFVSKEELDEHIKGHKTFACDQCWRTYTLIGRLRKHIESSHHPDGRKFACEVCGKMFLTHTTLHHHRMVHDEKKFACQEPGCELKFVHNFNLLRHMRRVHTTERNFKCEECDKAFKTKCKLKDHMDRHRGVKKAFCEICKKGFWDNDKLNVHMRTHTGVKPYSCTVCLKAFSQKYDCTKHMKNVHSKDDIKEVL